MIKMLSGLLKRTIPPMFIVTLTFTNKFQNATLKQYPFIELNQHNANKPIEDRMTAVKLQHINAYYVAVFDGHGGDIVAETASAKLHTILNKNLKQNNETQLSESEKIRKSLTESFQQLQKNLENMLCKNLVRNNFTVGSCALIALVTPTKIFIANAGDCEGLIVNSKTSFRKTNRRLNAGQKDQQQRLKKLFPDDRDLIVCNRRNVCYVKGSLQPTFSFGDFHLKKKQYNIRQLPNFTGPYIEHRPEITEFDIVPGDKYLILATDGLWDELTHDQVNQIALKSVNKNETGKQIMKNAFSMIKLNTNISDKQLFRTDISRRNIHDDISVIVFNLESDRSSQ